MFEQRDFSADVLSVGAARHFAAAAIAPCADELRQAVELLVSELATNAVRHVGSEFTVTISRDVAFVRVEVADYGGGVPTLCHPGPEALSGRGLEIVDACSDRWGVTDHTAGKMVWFELSGESQLALSA